MVSNIHFLHQRLIHFIHLSSSSQLTNLLLIAESKVHGMLVAPRTRTSLLSMPTPVQGRRGFEVIYKEHQTKWNLTLKKNNSTVRLGVRGGMWHRGVYSNRHKNRSVSRELVKELIYQKKNGGHQASKRVISM